MNFDWFTGLHYVLKREPDPLKIHAPYRQAHTLVRNVMFSLVVYEPYKGFRRTDTDDKLDGLTSQLDRVFHPIQLNVSTGGGATGGANRGIRIDSELRDLINFGKRRQDRDFHPYTLKVLQYLWDNKLKPFWCQVPVGDLQLNLATTLDMLCIDLNADKSNNNIVNIQLKTGFDRQYSRAGGKMLSPFLNDVLLKNMDDSYQNRHMLQNVTEHYMMQNNYGFPLLRSEVLVVNETETRGHILEVAPNLANTVVSELLNRNSVSELELATRNLRREYARRNVIKRAIAKKGKSSGKVYSKYFGGKE